MVVQVGYGFMGDDINILVILFYYFFLNICGVTLVVVCGNIVSGGIYVQEFWVIVLGFEVGTEYNVVLILLYSEVVQNVDGGQYKNVVIYGLCIGCICEL